MTGIGFCPVVQVKLQALDASYGSEPAFEKFDLDGHLGGSFLEANKRKLPRKAQNSAGDLEFELHEVDPSA